MAGDIILFFRRFWLEFVPLFYMVGRFLIFVAGAALWICAILNDVMMVRFFGKGLVLCSYNESFCFGLETRELKPLVCCFPINISFFNPLRVQAVMFCSHLNSCCIECRCFGTFTLQLFENEFFFEFYIELSIFLLSCCWTRRRSESLVDVRYAAKPTVVVL